MAETLSPSRLRQLAEVQPEQGRVLSVYMDLDPSEFGTAPARASQITSLVTEARHRIDELDDLDHDEQKALRADLQAVHDALTQPDIADDGARGVAVFACAPAGLLETVRVPRPLAQKVVIDRTPYIEPLLGGQDGGRWCVLLANRRSARFFLGTATALEETDRVVDNVREQSSSGGWAFERAIEQDVRDHLEHVARIAFEHLKAGAFEHLLIGAPQEIAGELEDHLHPYLRERLAGHVRLDVEHASVDDVRRATEEQVEEHERRREREALDRLRQRIGAGSRAAAGLEDVMRALAEARVETLLLTEGAEAGDAVEKALESGAEVMVVRHHADDLGPLGGIAALLRY